MPQTTTRVVRWKFAVLLILAAVWLSPLWMQRHDYALLKAINAGNVQAARQAFKDGATMQVHIRRDCTFLQAVARQGSVEMGRLLVEHGAGSTVTVINQNGDTALDIALANGHAEMADYLRSLTTKRPADRN